MPWNRIDHMAGLEGAAVDVAIVGGGIVGVGTALDLAARGASVAVIERHDFASGTSSRSTKLLHGGIRYLPQMRFGLIREGLSEQRVLAEIADYLCEPLDFVVPLYRGVSFGDLPALFGHHRVVPTALRIGLSLYDRMGRRGSRHRRTDASETMALAPGLKADGLKGAFVYEDVKTEDARLSLAVARTAVELGAVAVNHATVTEVTSDGDHYLLTVADGLEEDELSLRARVVIAASGSVPPPTPHGARPVAMRYSRGSHLIVDRAAVGVADAAIVLPETEDKRILYMIPWLGHALIGTTDVATEGDNGRPVASPEEVDYLIRHVARYTGVSPEPVTTFAGMRALASKGTGATGKASRKHKVAEVAPRFLQVAGGKLTGYRLIAAEIADKAARAIGLDRPSTTDRIALWGSGRMGIDRLTARYGTQADAVQALAAADPELAKQLGDGSLRAEVIHSVREEAAAKISDVTLQRTRLSWLTADHGRSAAPALSDLMGRELGWSDARRNQELQRFEADLAAEGL